MGAPDGFRDRSGAPAGAVRAIAQDLTPCSDARLHRLLVVRTVRACVYAVLLVAATVLAVLLQRSNLLELLALALLTAALLLLCITVGGLVRVRMERSARRRVAEALRSRS